MEKEFDPTKCKYHETDSDDLKDDLYGNGSEGLKVRFARMETRVKLMLTIEVTLLIGILSLVIKTFA